MKTRGLGIIQPLSGWLQRVAGASLVFLMALTVLDVVLRAAGRPIPGVYELVGFAGALAIGLAMPATSWARGHVHVDSLLNRLPPGGRRPPDARLLSCAGTRGLRAAPHLIAFIRGGSDAGHRSLHAHC